MTDLLCRGGVGFLVRGLRQRGTVALGLAAMAGAAGSAYCGVQAIHYRQAAVAERAAAQAELAQLRDELGGARQALSAAQERLGEAKDEARDKIAASEQAASSNAERIAQLTLKLDQVQRALRLAEAQRATFMARLSRSEVEAAQDLTRRQEELRAEQEQVEKRLRQLTADRDKITSERDKAETERNRLRSRVGELEQKLSMQSRQPPRLMAGASPAPATPPREAEPRVASLPPAHAAPAVPVAAAPPVPAATAEPAPAPSVAEAPAPVPAVAAASEPPSAGPPPAAAIPAVTAAPPATTTAAPVTPAAPPAVAYAATAPVTPPVASPVAYAAAPPAQRPATPAAVPAVAHGGVAQFERVLASAGIDVKNLFSQYGVRSGLGGPYIPNPRGSQPETLSDEKLAALSRMVKSLPVAAPLHSYEIGSRFGVRGDPIHGRAALHTGTDFIAPYMSPVYATAAGVVTFSGYRDDYGRIVEINHGNGLVTRYGHLHRTTVSVGQQVAGQTQIGFLGSSGRATGPHVHYEVVVNGEPQDPEKFISLGRIVSVASRR